MGFALIYFTELLNAHELDAAAVLEGVLKVVRLAVRAWMAPLELYAVRLANDFGEHALANEALLRLVELLLLLRRSSGHENDLLGLADRRACPTWWRSCFLASSSGHSLVFFCVVVLRLIGLHAKPPSRSLSPLCSQASKLKSTTMAIAGRIRPLVQRLGQGALLAPDRALLQPMESSQLL